MKKIKAASLCFAIVALFLMTSWAYAATFVVDNLGDVDDGYPYTASDGTNTLRKCIRLANSNAGADTINFGVSGVISPTSALPSITDDGTVIDASSRWIGTWPGGEPGIELDGSSAGPANGLWIYRADNCHIRGLFVTGFSHGIAITGSKFNTVGGTGVGHRNVISGNAYYGVYIGGSGTSYNVVSGNYIGTDVTGTADLGNTYDGVYIAYGAQSNTIGGDTEGERNIISGNDRYGVEIIDSGTANNVVSGNYIGTDVTGTADLGNKFHGVIIYDGAQSNTIGGDTEGERNIISGNDRHGVYILFSGTSYNVVCGNYIGTDVTGTADLGNVTYGVCIAYGAQSNTIGGTTGGERNIISGNDGHGVVIYDTGTVQNVVSGNYIGTDVTGTADLGNGGHGVYIGGAQSNTIGGDTGGERNIISGNDYCGVVIGGTGTVQNVVSGNYIGTDVTGTADLGNNLDGVYIGGAQSNTIGGDTEGERNIISGNDDYGVEISDSGTANNVVSGNYIGTDVTGTADLGNRSGVSIVRGAQSNTIGGDTEGKRNIISGNDIYGVYIGGPGTSYNVVCGNYIGTDVTGTADLGNNLDGVYIAYGAQSNTIGGDTEGERNIISGNDRYGVYILSSGTSYNVVCGNYIGTDVTGTADLGNTYDGVHIYDGAQSNTIGGDTEGERNIISGNDYYGVYIGGSGTAQNVVSGNYIGTDVTGTADLGNGRGVFIGGGAQSNTIGGTTGGERNIISGNNDCGAVISDSGTANNVVSGNYIGTDVTGTADLGNNLGVWIDGGAQSNTIGGTTGAERNIISGNDAYGVEISGSGNNVVLGNYIGTDVTGTADLGNKFDGVIIDGGAQSNTIGGDTEGERNIISGNDYYGVVIGGTGTVQNVVSGNYIGTDFTGAADLGNGDDGVFIYDGAQSNTIGGDTEGERNIISGNDKDSVYIGGSGTDNNVVSGNYIGTDVTGTDNLGNSRYGVYIVDGAQSNTIGGDTEGERNIISGNDLYGVFIGGSGTDQNVVCGNYIGTDVTGNADLGNRNGVFIGGGAQSNTIGGDTEGERNIISGNNYCGVYIGDSGTSQNVVSGNYIGTDVTGTADLGNGSAGVFIDGGAQSNTIGGATPGERNIISGNDAWGVHISGTGTSQNVVSGNYIGTDVNGTADLGNRYDGVCIEYGAQNTIGGDTEGERNIISGNAGYGVFIGASGTSQNVVSGNYIGTDVNGTADLGNGNAGVYIDAGAQSNTIGGDTEGERNIISGNDHCGVFIQGSGNNVVSGNYIGTDVTGTADLGNGNAGVYIDAGAHFNTIAGNTIAFNGDDGVLVKGEGTDYNRISHNSLHNNSGLGIDLENGGNDEIPAPAVASAELIGNILTVSGVGAGTNATVEIFQADSSGSGEGMTYLGSLTADGSGDFSGLIDVTGIGLSIGDPLVATTTHTDSNTSEFSVAVLVVISLPLIGIEPADFTFIALPGGVNPDDQILAITNTGSGVLLWAVSDDADWLFLSPANGDNTGEIDEVTVSVSIAGLSEGTYTGNITISSPNATNSPQMVPVNLFVGEIHEHDMELGWNFVSSPLQLQNGDPGVVLSSISTKCNAAWSCDPDTGWHVYIPNGPSTLGKMERGKGYLIDMNESGTLVIQGTNPGPEPIFLEGGKWHLVGHNSLSSLPIANIEPSMPDGTYICTYDSQLGKWLTYAKGCPDFLNTLTLLAPGHSYWAYVAQNWTINY